MIWGENPLFLETFISTNHFASSPCGSTCFCCFASPGSDHAGKRGFSGALKCAPRVSKTKNTKRVGECVVGTIGSMGLVYFPTWMVDFYGKCRWIYHTWILWGWNRFQTNPTPNREKKSYFMYFIHNRGLSKLFKQTNLVGGFNPLEQY